MENNNNDFYENLPGITGEILRKHMAEQKIVRPQQLLFEEYLKDVYEKTGRVVLEDGMGHEGFLTIELAKDFIQWRREHPNVVKQCGVDPNNPGRVDKSLAYELDKAIARLFVKKHIQSLSYSIGSEDELGFTTYYVDSKETMRSILKEEGFFDDETIEDIVKRSDEYKKETGDLTSYTRADAETLERLYGDSSDPLEDAWEMMDNSTNDKLDGK